jgi:hypothetical protein
MRLIHIISAFPISIHSFSSNLPIYIHVLVFLSTLKIVNMARTTRGRPCVENIDDWEDFLDFDDPYDHDETFDAHVPHGLEVSYDTEESFDPTDLGGLECLIPDLKGINYVEEPYGLQESEKPNYSNDLDGSIDPEDPNGPEEAYDRMDSNNLQETDDSGGSNDFEELFDIVEPYDSSYILYLSNPLEFVPSVFYPEDESFTYGEPATNDITGGELQHPSQHSHRDAGQFEVPHRR